MALSYDSPPSLSPFLPFPDYAAPAGSAASASRGRAPAPWFRDRDRRPQGEPDRDSTGNKGKIGPGDVQWMTAARHRAHEEMHGASSTRRAARWRWFSLGQPAREPQMSPLGYQDTEPAASGPLAGGAGTVGPRRRVQVRRARQDLHADRPLGPVARGKKGAVPRPRGSTAPSSSGWRLANGADTVDEESSPSPTATARGSRSRPPRTPRSSSSPERR